MAYGFRLAPKAAAFLNAMPAGKMRAQVAKKARDLMEHPHPPGCKKLESKKHDGDPIWRVRVGDFRILYVCRKDELVVILIGDRKECYR